MEKTSNNHRYTRLDLKDREHIETFLNEDSALKDIAAGLSKDPRGISYEIKKHRQLVVKKNMKNVCGLKNSCAVQHLCNDCKRGLCKFCSNHKCRELCPYFQSEPECKRTLRFPYVCNGCNKQKECTLPKYFYKAHKAFEEYKDNVTDFKKGNRIKGEELKNLDYCISQAVRNGHSIAVGLKTHNLSHAPSTIYRYIDNGLLSTKGIDLKRKCRYRKRKKKILYVRDYNCLEGRRHDDFVEHIRNNPSVSLWQMDTIEGKKGSNEKAVLSLLHTGSNLQLYFILSSICIEEVKRVIDHIKEHLGIELFKEIFEVILTDNGHEFKDPLSIETDKESGEKLISVFYCEPRRSDQKGSCEKNHEHFRELIPKGISMNPYDQSDMNHVSLMVNNYPRKKFGYKSPLEVAGYLNEKVFELNDLRIVSPDKVILKHLNKNR